MFRQAPVDDAFFLGSRLRLRDDFFHARQFASLQRRIEAQPLEVIQLVVVQKAVFVDVAQFEYARQGGNAGWLEGLAGGHILVSARVSFDRTTHSRVLLCHITAQLGAARRSERSKRPRTR